MDNRLSRLSMLGLVAVILNGCVTAEVPQDQKSGYKGKGTIVSIMTTKENYQEIGVKTSSDQHIVVVVKEPVEVYPGQKVSVNRLSGGFGMVSPE